MTDEEYSAEIALDRASTYRFFSQMLLHEVTAEFLEMACANPPDWDGVLGEYFTSLAGKDLEAARRDAVADFSAALLNMSANPVAVYESVYTSPLHLMMQDARDEVLAAYRAQGIQVLPEMKLPEDHISFELEFMAMLCEREAASQEALDAAALGACRAAQQSFMRDHLSVWVPEFCKGLAAHAKTGLYRGIAEALDQFMAFEKTELGIDGD